MSKTPLSNQPTTTCSTKDNPAYQRQQGTLLTYPLSDSFNLPSIFSVSYRQVGKLAARSAQKIPPGYVQQNICSCYILTFLVLTSISLLWVCFSPVLRAHLTSNKQRTQQNQTTLSTRTDQKRTHSKQGKASVLSRLLRSNRCNGQSTREMA